MFRTLLPFAVSVFAGVLALQPHLCAADIEFSRKVDFFADGTFNLKFKQGCKGTDKYGDVKCAFPWGQTLSGVISGSLSKDITEGSTVKVALKLDGLIPYHVQCPVCGDECTIVIPVLQKSVHVPTPPCPIKAGHMELPFTLPLPTESPVEVTTTAKGTVTLYDKHDQKLLQVEFKAKVKPDNSFAEDDRWRMKWMRYSVEAADEMVEGDDQGAESGAQFLRVGRL